MATEPKSRRRRRKKILRKNDGSLFDATERRRITATELREYIRAGGLFEARRHENGEDCTYEVLQEVVGVGFLQQLVPGLGGGSIPGLGALSGLAGGGGPLGALGGAAGVAGLLRALGEQSGGGGGDWDDWDPPPKRKKGDPRGWGDDDWSGEEPRRSNKREPGQWVPDPDFD